jgi:lysophospholipase L1-like esterase
MRIFLLCTLLALSSTGLLVADEPKASAWEAEIRKFEDQDAKTPPAKGAILFVGSSSIRLWNLAESFPGLVALNRGFGGSQIADSTEFAERIVLPYQPKTIVIYAGDNDIASGKSPERVAEDYRAFVAKVHAALPETRIIYLSIKPSIQRWKLVDKMRSANKLIEEFSQADKRLVYLDVGVTLLGEDGQPRADLFEADGLHLNRAGYKRWSEKLLPLLQQSDKPAAKQS